MSKSFWERKKKEKGQVQTIIKNELAVSEREGIPSGHVATTLNATS